MADYIKINEHSNKGDLAISKKVICEIVNEAKERILGTSSKDSKNATLTSPIKISFSKDGKVKIGLVVEIKKNSNPEVICLKLQEEIARDLALYTESLPFEIEISIADIK